MRIAVWHNLPSGGGKRALYDHVKTLQARGHYLEAWTTDMSSTGYLPLNNIIIEHRLPVKARFDNASRYRNPIKRIKAQISLMQEHCRTCIKEIESQSFDVIFVNSCLFSYISYISNYAKIPALIYLGEPCRRLFDSMPENVWQAPSYKFELKNIRRFIRDFNQIYAKRIQLREEIVAAKKYNSILVNSLFSRENVIRSYGIDARVCYLGIDENTFSPIDSDKEPYVVSTGTIGYIKSVHKAIKVISKIPLEVRPILKWISNANDEYYFNEIISLAKKLNVQFEPLTNISDDEMASILSKAAIMIYTPSLEPFGLAPLEANLCGTYVVAVAEGGVRESIIDGKNGRLIYNYDESEISKVILKFITDLTYAKLKGDEACLFVRENWSIQKMADNIESELKKLIK
jgi:glycosyltransferase involved in cell wall biosynthesis